MFERCLYFNLNALSRKVNKLWDQAFAELELSPAHAYLLRVVLANPGITQQAIAAELSLEKSTIARFVESLEKRDLIQRLKSGREQLVYPTPQSEAMGQRLEQIGEALYQQMLERFGDEALVKLVADLRVGSHRLS